MLTSLMRTRPWLGYGLALVITVLLIAIGVTGAANTAGSTPGTALFFAFLGGVGGLVLVSLTFELRLRHRRPFAELAATPAGEAATFLPFAGFPLRNVVAVLALALVVSGGGLVMAARAGVPGWVALCAVVALGSLALLQPVARGQVSSGGVWLTPGGIEHRRFGTSWRVAWDDVTRVIASEPLPVLVRKEDAVHRERTSRFWWKGDVQAVDGVLGIETRYLSVDDVVLARLLEGYLAHPETRHRLGTAESLDGRLPR